MLRNRHIFNYNIANSSKLAKTKTKTKIIFCTYICIYINYETLNWPAGIEHQITEHQNIDENICKCTSRMLYYP